MMHLFNTLTKKKEELLPGKDNTIRMFVCGPTVYDYMHIGNARTLVFFDVLAKYLQYRGYDLAYIQNITDIDDKIIARAKEQNKDPLDYAHEFEEKFLEDASALGITSPEYKRATDHIPEVISQVQRLIEKDHAYLIEGDGWYFDLTTFPDYGKLSGRTTQMADDAVSRIDENDKKRNKGDFCLWKISKPGEPSWDSPWGKGRPGWHIEDTAITEKYFGPQYDLHGGAIDLMFPHHEAEVTQMESVSGFKPFVKYWVHAGFLVNKSAKMSKSAGNFTTARKALNTYSSEALRFYFLSSHYRAPLELSEQSMQASEAAVSRIAEFMAKIDRFEDELPSEENSAIATLIKKSKTELIETLDDDFNTPQAFAILFNLIKEINPLIAQRKLDQSSAQDIKEYLSEINSVLGIITSRILDIPRTVEMLIEQRERARASKDYAAADKHRAEIQSQGFTIDDTPYGPLVKKL